MPITLKDLFDNPDIFKDALSEPEYVGHIPVRSELVVVPREVRTRWEVLLGDEDDDL